jgi:DNA-binding FadR family transcriptional regulator
MALQRVSLSNMAVDELLRLIQERELQASDSLPPTAELAEELDVSRTVIREAIAELAGQGLLQRRQGKETVIQLPDASQLERLLRLRFVVKGADFRSLQEYREVIEVGSARLAAERATAEDVAALAERLKELRAAAGGDEMHLKDQAFHREIARMSGNDMVLLTLDGITPLLVELRQHAWAGWTKAGGQLDEVIEAHQLVFDAVAAGDGPAAADAMQRHLTQATQGLLADSASAGTRSQQRSSAP